MQKNISCGHCILKEILTILADVPTAMFFVYGMNVVHTNDIVEREGKISIPFRPLFSKGKETVLVYMGTLK